MNTNFNKLIQKSLIYIFLILSAYILCTILFFFLPKEGIDNRVNVSTNLKYTKYDGFYSTAPVFRNTVVIKKVKKDIKTLSKYTLKAIYSTTSNGGWLNMENNSNRQSYILSQGENIEDYTLTKLYRNYVIFEKNKKEYILEIKQSKQKVNYNMSEVINDIKQNIVVSNDNVKITRSYLNSYVNDIDKVWKDINIQEIRENGKIDGFKVFRVSKKSVFSKLGLRKGDIIKSINNNTLTSYAEAFKVYNNMSDTKYLNLEILRNNEIMELNYEID